MIDLDLELAQLLVPVLPWHAVQRHLQLATEPIILQELVADSVQKGHIADAGAKHDAVGLISVVNADDGPAIEQRLQHVRELLGVEHVEQIRLTARISGEPRTELKVID